MLEEEKDIVKQVVAACRVAGDTVQKLNDENRRLWKALIACIVCIAVMACCMVWAVANAQKIANEAMANALETVAEIGMTTEETNTTVSQDTGEGTGNNVYLQENGTYNESGAE